MQTKICPFRGKKSNTVFFFIVSLQASIRNTFYDKKSPQHNNEEEKTLCTIFLKKIVSLQASIRNTFLDQKSPQHPEVGVLKCCTQTNRQTDLYGDSMTDLAQGAYSVKIS